MSKRSMQAAAAAGLLFAALLGAAAMLPQGSEAALLVCPGLASEAAGEVHGDAVVATPPVAPADFADRGRSMDNPAGRLAAWEAHFHSPVVDGPVADDRCE
jgi:hypothetical protein